jgi:hypothetical protein
MSTDFFIIPKDQSFNDIKIIETTLETVCTVQNASYEKLNDGVYTIESKSEKDIGFAVDWIKNAPYDWENEFNPETEKPSGPMFNINTHTNSIPFTLKFLELLLAELKKLGIYFSLFDPQTSEFITKNTQ